MTYQGSLTRLRESTADDVMKVWRAYGLGRISKPQFVQLAAALIHRAQGQASALADLAFSTEMMSKTGNYYLPSGDLPRVYNQSVLESGVSTLLDDSENGTDITARLERFALNAPLDAAHEVYGKGVAGSRMVEGWVRQLDGNPCQLCRWWWREGRVWPKDHIMPHHKGCTCVQMPVVVEKTNPVDTRRR